VNVTPAMTQESATLNMNYVLLEDSKAFSAQVIEGTGACGAGQSRKSVAPNSGGPLRNEVLSVIDVSTITMH
jgi:hypothetical protein